ncbi:hypothetical protein OAB00_01260 [Akkermansiaceae bacterium]|nr:hypothetical protein [Akkermansiaceae bacterium]
MNKKQSEKGGVNLEDIFSQDNADRGELLEITLPTGGEFKLRVKGYDSFEYRSARAKMNASEVKRKKLEDEVYFSEKEMERRHVNECKLHSVLITGWEGVNGEFTKERAENMLIKSPYVLVLVKDFASNRVNFMKGLQEK